MPLYEYRCRECNATHQKLERASALSNGTCPQCGGEATRLIGVPALQFKGSGWYVNDYAKKSGAESADTTTPASDATSPATKDATPSSTDKPSKPAKADKPAGDKVA